ncbi:MAG: MBL fold metallo-hydrolase [Dysgonamonadaceae bacterium]|jgi:glyoxylase-like metal-dependent hydrolase (beta-lactamase superfamily II)|nr:MBL fold metallo-hydrolase [Dysgonamonadaceae bacterium]
MLNIKIFVVNQVRENTYLIWDETREAAIIDCGAYYDEEKTEIVKFIKDNNLTLKRILNTHLHFDHIMGNAFLFKTYGIKPEYNAEDEEMPFKSGHVKAEHYLSDGDEIRFGNTVLKAIATPGHSPGSLSFYCADAGCVFTGDALFHLDIGRTDLWKGDYEELLRSIRTRLFALPETTVVYPGHEESSTIGVEKRENPHAA